MDRIRWGILATGHIATSMAEALHAVEDAELVAVGSRAILRAEAFGDQWQVPRRYGSYDALVADPNIDIIYIATPHSRHAANIRLCLEAGKHVLCEKPLTVNAREAAECIALARQRQKFLMEAVWTRFFPAIDQVRRWVADGTIGQIRSIQADFCLNIPFLPTHRLYDPALGGGALLDLGIYPLTLTTMLLGFPLEVQSIAHVGKTGVDEQNALTLVYETAIAQLGSSVTHYKPHEAWVVGTQGYIQLHHSFFHPHRLTLATTDKGPETEDYPYLGNGYPHEVLEVHRCLRNGQLESELMPLDETQRMMQLMDRLRAEWGVAYPAD